MQDGDVDIVYGNSGTDAGDFDANKDILNSVENPVSH
jgi:hypothetical protein